ncbi:hypothetical protein D9M71_582250 [compost metagenome]
MAPPQARMLASTLRWARATPFGSPVEPEVYWIRASESAPAARGASGVVACSCSGSSTCRRSGASPVSSRANGRTSPEVISTGAWQLRRMPAWRRRWSSICAGRAGGYIGTGMPPANRMPKKQRKKSSPEGSINATHCPGCRPPVAKAAAIRPAASASWA